MRRSTFSALGIILALAMFFIAAVGKRGNSRPDGESSEAPVFQDHSILHEAGVVIDAVSADSVSGLMCQLNRKIAIPEPRFGCVRDSILRTTRLYIGDYDSDQILRYEIDSSLTCLVESLTVEWGTVYHAADLDLDGGIELIVQRGDPGGGGNGYLDILSSPDWVLRQRFTFPGEKIGMGPVVVNVDEDPFLEVFAIPQGFNTGGHAIVIDFRVETDSFEIVADIAPPSGASASAAVADFDNDGRMEFVTANYEGYGLFEWRDDTLNFAGQLVTPYSGVGRRAIACRPKPNGLTYALVAYTDLSGFDYHLLEPTGDNTFQFVKTFHDSTGALGSAPCFAADTDCDGLEEILLGFFPRFEVWEWDVAVDSFALGCYWDYTVFGSNLNYWYAIDFDWDGRQELCPVTNSDTLVVLPDPDCESCGSDGRCIVPLLGCACECSSDPQCDGRTDVIDVVLVIDVAFRGGGAIPDLSTACPQSRTDADCTETTDIVDVVRIVNVAFRGAASSVEFCSPCP